MKLRLDPDILYGIILRHHQLTIPPEAKDLILMVGEVGADLQVHTVFSTSKRRGFLSVDAILKIKGHETYREGQMVELFQIAVDEALLVVPLGQILLISYQADGD